MENWNYDLADDGETFAVYDGTDPLPGNLIAHCDSPDIAMRIVKMHTGDRSVEERRLREVDHCLRARVAELEAALAWHPASAPPDSSREVVGYCTDGYLRLVNYENPTWNCTPYGFADVVEWCEIPLRMKDTP
jgi:hypothetical protein